MIVRFITTSCNQYLSPQTLWVWIPLRWGVLDTTLCDKVCQWLATGRWFSPGTPVSSTNKADHHDITEILLKVALNTINQPYNIRPWWKTFLKYHVCPFVCLVTKNQITSTTTAPNVIDKRGCYFNNILKGFRLLPLMFKISGQERPF
jgi:hypothetical protein